LASEPFGTVLRSRPIDLSAFALLPAKVRAWQLLYRTLDYRWRAMATVTTVVAPVDSPPKGIVSYQIAEDASAADCAPSVELASTNDASTLANQGYLAVDALNIDALVAQGFAVSIPDYEGPNSDFGAGYQPGYAILDGLRAAESFAPLGLAGTSTPAALWGYSGGALASGWAAEVQPTYVPNLNLRGVAVGGFPTQVPQIFSQVEKTVFSGLLVGVIPGMLRTDPTLSDLFYTYLNPAGVAALAAAAKQCVIENIASADNMNNYLTIPWSQFLSMPAVVDQLNKYDLGGLAPKAPLFVYHAVNDELVPIQGPTATVASYCQAGDSVTFIRDEVSEHVTLDFIGAPAALNWLTQRLDGQPAPQHCSTETVSSMALTAAELGELPSFLTADLRILLAEESKSSLGASS
jgi:hypothetical protein